MSLRIDLVEDHVRWAKLDSEERRQRFLRKMLDARTMWVSHLRKKSIEYVLPWMRYTIPVADDWTSFATTPERAGDFECRGSFLYYLLAQEATERTLARVAKLRALARDMGKGKKILVYGADAGTYMYPWAEQEYDTTAVIREGSWYGVAFKTRMRQDFVRHSLREVSASWYESGLRSRYDLVLCLDLLDRVNHPVALVEHLGKMADTLVLSCSFSPTSATPWVRGKSYSTEHEMSAIADRLVGDSPRSLRKTLDPSCDWGDDLLIFR